MQQFVISTLKNALQGKLDKNDLELVLSELSKILSNSPVDSIKLTNDSLLTQFVSSKRLEGCSEKTISYYSKTLKMMFERTEQNAINITTETLRDYLSNYQSLRHSSKITIDNIRRIFSSFFSWMENEEYILKSPVRRIHKVKFGRTVKDTFSDEDLEIMRDNCDSIRNLSIVDFLSSTGVRVGELVRLNRADIDFNGRECIVFGKGDCQRPVYFDARTKLHLKEYLNNRTGQNPALFVSSHNPHQRLTINGTESMLKELEKRSGVSNIHPHKFRRTMATHAIDKGMPIEQVQRLLGHVRIDTTLHYAMVNQENVKNAHRRFIS